MNSAVTAMVLLACVAGSLAVKCYTCVGCAQFDYAKPSSELFDCGSSVTKCAKTDADIFGTKITSRSCGSACVEAEILGTRTYCCDGEGCNGAAGLSISLFGAFITAAVAYFLH